MGHHVIQARCNIPGWYVKKIGTFAEGSKWAIDFLPKEVFDKANDEGFDAKGRKVRAISFMTPSGSWINKDDAYVPKFNHGKPPSEPIVVDGARSTKVRNSVPEIVTPPENNQDESDAISKLNEGDNEENEEINEDNKESTNNDNEVTSSKKKVKKKIKKIKRNVDE